MSAHFKTQTKNIVWTYKIFLKFTVNETAPFGNKMHFGSACSHKMFSLMNKIWILQYDRLIRRTENVFNSTHIVNVGSLTYSDVYAYAGLPLGDPES